jgi:signal transduction histidine kinase
VQSVQPLADQQRVTLIVEAATPYVHAVDPVRVQQVVWNLLANALRATAAAAGSRRWCGRPATDVEIVVRDTGEGIAPAMLKSMFEPFRRRSGRSGRGLGLGLAITRQIVEAHGGTITAHSAGAGAGATFTVTLPRRMRERPK